MSKILACKRDAAPSLSYLTEGAPLAERRAGRSISASLLSRDIVDASFEPAPGRTPPPADGCCRMRPGCTSFDSLRSTNQHERSNACSCGGGGQSCSSDQLQLSRVRVCGGVRSSHYVEAATDRLLSTVPQRSMISNDIPAGSATANSGTCSPQSPIGKRVFLVSIGPKVSIL